MKPILSCRPADLSTLPLIPGKPLDPLEPGWVEQTCATCGQTVHMGVKQKAMLDEAGDPTFFVILCMMCSLMWELRS